MLEAVFFLFVRFEMFSSRFIQLAHFFVFWPPAQRRNVTPRHRLFLSDLPSAICSLSEELK